MTHQPHAASASASTAGGAACTLPKLLRCFCNCTELTYAQVHQIARLTVPQLFADNALALNMLKQVLRLGTTDADRPLAYRHVEHAELCVRVLRRLRTATPATEFSDDDDTIDELFDRCPSLAWERRLREADEDAEPERKAALLGDYCEELSESLFVSIRTDAKWADFQRELRRKLEDS